MNLQVFGDAEGVAHATADVVAAAITAGARSLVLAGGSTPRRAYQLLAAMDLTWGRVSVLFGDERCVPPDDPESNYRLARDELLSRVSPASVHRMPAELGAEEAAELYSPIVAALAPLDLAVLGMGPDGHTASLFPGHAALSAIGWVVAVHDAPKPPPDRVSLTMAALHQARRVLVVVTGEDKAQALARAQRGEVPAGMIPWAEFLVDRTAASAL